MQRSVRILIRSVQRPIIPENEQESSWENPQCQWMESETIGEYYEKGDSRYCLYEEQQEDWDQPARAVLKWKGHTMELQRKGIMAARMVFEPGKSYCHPYRTPYGEMLMEVETRLLQIQEDEESILLAAEYGLKLDGQTVSENRVEIHIEYI